MKMNPAASLIAILGILMVSGCAASVNPGQIDAIEQFLSKNPGTTITSVYLAESQINEEIGNISELCNKQIEIQPYYLIEANTGEIEFTAYVDMQGNAVCSVAKSLKSADIDDNTGIKKEDNKTLEANETVTQGSQKTDKIKPKIGFETVDKGSQLNGVEKGNYVIRTEGEWAQFWQNLHSSETSIKTLPEVDFNGQMIIAVFMGTQPTGGYGIEIQKTIETGDEVKIVVKRTAPGAEDIVTMSMSSPYHIVKMQKTEKKLLFVEEMQSAPVPDEPADYVRGEVIVYFVDSATEEQVNLMVELNGVEWGGFMANNTKSAVIKVPAGREKGWVEILAKEDIVKSAHLNGINYLQEY